MSENNFINIQPWVRGTFLTWYINWKRSSLVLTAGLITTIYWIVPFIVSAAYGTAFHSGQINALRVLLGASSIQNPAFHGLAYTQDYVHLVFTLLLAIGGAIAHLIVKQVNSKLGVLIEALNIENKGQEFLRIYRKYLARAYSNTAHIIAFFFTVICFLFFIKSAELTSNSSWWGYCEYGPAGYIFSVCVGIMVYGGTRSALSLAFLSLMLGKLAIQPMKFQPFHADGCNGLQPFGYLALMLWIYALVLASSVYVVFHFGYLGIENLPGTWLLALMIGICTPAIAFVPVIIASLSVQKSKREYLMSLEHQAGLLFPFSPNEIEKHLSSVDKIKGILEYKRALQDENVLPFRPRTIGTMALATTIQYFLALKQLFP